VAPVVGHNADVSLRLLYLICQDAYPLDTGSTMRYQPAIRPAPPRHPLPAPLTMTDFEQLPRHHQRLLSRGMARTGSQFARVIGYLGTHGAAGVGCRQQRARQAGLQGVLMGTD
jgi:hypothetical protein